MYDSSKVCVAPREARPGGDGGTRVNHLAVASEDFLWGGLHARRGVSFPAFKSGCSFPS